MSEVRQLLDKLIELEDRNKAIGRRVASLRLRARAWMEKPMVKPGDGMRSIEGSIRCDRAAEELQRERFDNGLRIRGIERLLRRMAAKG